MSNVILDNWDNSTFDKLENVLRDTDTIVKLNSHLKSGRFAILAIFFPISFIFRYSFVLTITFDFLSVSL